MLHQVTLSTCPHNNPPPQVVYMFLVLLALGLTAPQFPHDLPVLFQFTHPTHNVAVFRGADLMEAIDAGMVMGFDSSEDENRDGKSDDQNENLVTIQTFDGVFLPRFVSRD